MKELLAVARGEIPADLVIRGARVANVFTQEFEEVDVAVFKDRIAGLGKGFEGKTIVDGGGKVLTPGLIDGHIHIESTMLVPSSFAECVVARGTTAVMADPHEIANALGMKGIEYMYLASRGLPVDVFLGAPSCVPASAFETPFEELEMDDVHEMFRQKWCHHLGEVMNYPGAIKGDPSVWGKIQAAGEAVVTGHAPEVRGNDLCAYIAGGISSDHECSDLEEGLEKLRRGMWLMMREGASTSDLPRLLPLVKSNPLFAARCMAVTDDCTAKYLLQAGHMDEKIRIMVREGLDPLLALRMVTLSPASYFGLKNRGAIGPGMLADMVLVEDLEKFRVDKVWKNGVLTVDEGEVCRKVLSCVEPVRGRRMTNATPLTERQLEVSIPREAELCVIGVDSGSLVTRTVLTPPLLRTGIVVPDPERDIAKIVVRERHQGTGRFSVGFVQGLRMTRGAIASSVAHDAHNLVAAGMDNRSILSALSHLEKMGGGLTVTEGENVLGFFALPVAGLMTTLDAVQTTQALDELDAKAFELGIEAPHPFMVLSFLCLSVIPELKITDQGYVDIVKGKVQPLFNFSGFREAVSGLKKRGS